MLLKQSSVFRIPQGQDISPVEVAFLHLSADIAERITARDVDLATERTALIAHMGFELDKDARDISFDRIPIAQDCEVASSLVGIVRREALPLRNAVALAIPLVSERLPPVLQPLLADTDPAVRATALTLLQGLQSQPQGALALATVELNPEINVCETASQLVAVTGGPETIKPLMELVRRMRDVPVAVLAAGGVVKRMAWQRGRIG